MSAQKAQTPWWERPAQASGRPGVDAERERLRSELARAWRACTEPAGLRSSIRGRLPRQRPA